MSKKSKGRAKKPVKETIRPPKFRGTMEEHEERVTDWLLVVMGKAVKERPDILTGGDPNPLKK